MAPVPHAINALTRQAVTYVGGNDSALSWNTVLAVGAVMAAAMQGTLGIESADPCRLSYKKYKMLLTLEAVEVVIVVASEVFSFIQLNNALKERLQWLQWLPPCLLVIGLLELVADLWLTCFLTASSRLNWMPLSSVGWEKKGKTSLFSTLAELGPLCVTAVLSFVLIGWRMRWWWGAAAVDSVVAEKALSRNRALSVGAIGFSVGWGLLLSATLFVLIAASEISTYPWSVFRRIFDARNPIAFYSNNTFEKAMERKPTRELIEKFKKLFEVEYDEPLTHTDDEITQFLKQAPLHVGNAVVSSDKDLVFGENFHVFKDAYMLLPVFGTMEGFSRIFHLVFLFVEHFTILPLQCCVLAAVAQLYSNLDEPGYAALTELVDAVIVVALVELAIGFKSFLWSQARVGKLHPNDRTSSDPPASGDKRGLLHRCFY